ncbi:hypothetical protein BHM03_00036787 [Ensete ventricosum]|uniref:Uncharacterized protein n=1 Tax=Ensete ventricosum TaxID=4639 RepID=A0A445MJG3_ENSVE|nr:hypothetical protein BHM03_00036787 [Ensete ventricosum]
MSQEHSTPVNPGEDAPPTTQPTSGGAYRPLFLLPSFEEGNIPSHTQGRYWSLLNDSGLSPPSHFRGLPNRTKDEHVERPLRGSPFIQEFQDAHIPSHFRLPILEAYDDSSDPTEHVAAFHAQMTLRYCRFHHDYEHDIEECYDLKNQIEDLIHRGHLDRYIRESCEPSLRLKGPVKRHIDVIVGGPTTGGVSSSARKAYARAEVHKRP